MLYVLQKMKLTPTERAEQAHGKERLGIYLSYMRKRPGMYFGAPPYLEPLHNFLLGYDIAELCHEVDESHFPSDGFREWLIAEKGLRESCQGWPGMIREVETDVDAQLQLAIDLLAEHGSIPLLDESDV